MAEEKDVCKTEALDFGPVIIRLLTKAVYRICFKTIALDKIIWRNIRGQRAAWLIEV